MSSELNGSGGRVLLESGGPSDGACAHKEAFSTQRTPKWSVKHSYDSASQHDSQHQEDLFQWKISEITHYLVLHHLRSDIREHVTNLTQSTYDILSFKNLLFAMYQKPISYEMLQDLILLSSRQYRITMDLYRDLTNFFRICFLGENHPQYNADKFEGPPLLAGNKHATKHSDFFPEILKILEKRVVKGHDDPDHLARLHRLAEEHIPERTHENYDFTAFRLLMRQYKECMDLIVKQDDDLAEATTYIEELEPKLKQEQERNQQLHAENAVLQQKLLAMEQKYDQTFSNMSDSMFQKSGAQIRKAKNDQKLNKKYVSQLGKKFQDTVTTISSRLKLFHKTLLEVMDDEKSKISVESNVKMNTMIVHVTHLIQKFEDIRGALTEISTELDKVLKTKIQTASSGLTSLKAIAKENKKVLRAKKTLATMKTYLGDLKKVSQLIEDYENIRLPSAAASQDSSTPSTETLSKIRSLIIQNIQGVNSVHDDVHEVLSSIDLAAARSSEKEKKRKQDKKVKRFNLTVPIAQSQSSTADQQQKQESASDHPTSSPNKESSENPLDMEPRESNDSSNPLDLTLPSPPLSSWKAKRNSTRKHSFEEISAYAPASGGPLHKEQRSADDSTAVMLKSKYNEKIAFVKEVYDSRVQDLQQKLNTAYERIKELEKKTTKDNRGGRSFKRSLSRNSTVSAMSDGVDDASLQQLQSEQLHELHFAEDFNYVDPDEPEETGTTVAKLKSKTEKMMGQLHDIEEDTPVTKGLKRELKKKAKERIRQQKRGKKQLNDTFEMLQQVSPTMREYAQSPDSARPSSKKSSRASQKRSARRRLSPRSRTNSKVAPSGKKFRSSSTRKTLSVDDDKVSVGKALHFDDMPESESNAGAILSRITSSDMLAATMQNIKQDDDKLASSDDMSLSVEHTTTEHQSKDEAPSSLKYTEEDQSVNQAQSSKEQSNSDDEMKQGEINARKIESSSSARVEQIPPSSGKREEDAENASQGGSIPSRDGVAHSAHSFSNIDEFLGEEGTILSPDPIVEQSSLKRDKVLSGEPPLSQSLSHNNDSRPPLNATVEESSCEEWKGQGAIGEGEGISVRPSSEGALAQSGYHGEVAQASEYGHAAEEGRGRGRRSNSETDILGGGVMARGGSVRLPSIMTPFEGPPKRFGKKSEGWLSSRMKLLQESGRRERKGYVSNIDVFAMFDDDPSEEALQGSAYGGAATAKLGVRRAKNASSKSRQRR